MLFLRFYVRGRKYSEKSFLSALQDCISLGRNAEFNGVNPVPQIQDRQTIYSQKYLFTRHLLLNYPSKHFASFIYQRESMEILGVNINRNAYIYDVNIKKLLNIDNGLSILVLLVERTFITPAWVRIKDNATLDENYENQSWECRSEYFESKSGDRLFDEILRKLNVFLGNRKELPDGIAISVPGTVEGSHKILSSKRLGIVSPIDVTELFKQKKLPKCFVFHDTECMGIGEVKYGALKNSIGGNDIMQNFAYICVDEGIGSTLFINGSAFKGCGSAGHIGRLIVDPRGQYNPTFSSKGSLEVYCSRPWVSTNIVGQFLAEKGKSGNLLGVNSTFRDAVLTASEQERKWNTLPYHILAKGLETRDPIAVSIIEEASMYLGLAVNCLLSIVHPPAIIIGGGMVTHLPSFYDSAISYARRFSWELAWNRTVIRPSILDRKAQILGAAELFKNKTISP